MAAAARFSETCSSPSPGDPVPCVTPGAPDRLTLGGVVWGLCRCPRSDQRPEEVPVAADGAPRLEGTAREETSVGGAAWWPGAALFYFVRRGESMNRGRQTTLLLTSLTGGVNESGLIFKHLLDFKQLQLDL